MQLLQHCNYLHIPLAQFQKIRITRYIYNTHRYTEQNAFFKKNHRDFSRNMSNISKTF